MEFTVRPIVQSDDAHLGRLIKDVLTEFKANKPGTAFYDDDTDRLSTIFNGDKNVYWVVEAAGRIVGGGGVFQTDGLPADTCELVKLYLYPEARGKGLGKLLIETCLAHASAAGFKQVYLESMPELSQAVRLYESFGFKQLCGAMGNSCHFGCDIWMVKQLTN